MAKKRLPGGENVVMDTRQEGEISRQECEIDKLLTSGHLVTLHLGKPQG